MCYFYTDAPVSVNQCFICQKYKNMHFVREHGTNVQCPVYGAYGLVSVQVSPRNPWGGGNARGGGTGGGGRGEEEGVGELRRIFGMSQREPSRVSSL
jgi:hypothetical protein